MISDPFKNPHNSLRRGIDISFMESRYPLAHLLLLRAKLLEIVGIYQQIPLLHATELPVDEVKTQFAYEIAHPDINKLAVPFDNDCTLDEYITEITLRHLQITGIIQYLMQIDSYFDAPDARALDTSFNANDANNLLIPNAEDKKYKSFMDLRKRWYGSGLLGGWLTARRFIAAWFPGQHTLGELATQFKAWWLRTSLGRKLALTLSRRSAVDLPDPASSISTKNKHHPYLMRKQFLLEDSNKRHHTDKQNSTVKASSIMNFNLHVELLLISCETLLRGITHTARKAAKQEHQEDSVEIQNLKRLFIEDLEYQKTQIRRKQFKELRHAVFPSRGQRWGHRRFVFGSLFLACCLFGVTLIGMTLLAKLGILGFIAVKFSQLPLVALSLQHLVTFLTNIHIWQYITQTPEILMIAAGTCFYLGAWLVKFAHGSNYFQSLSNWFKAYPLYARTLCEYKLPLDRYNSIFSSKPKRRGIWYLPEEHSKEGADIPALFMLVKILLNPFRWVRAALVLVQYLLMWPLCTLVNFPFRTQEDIDNHPKRDYPYLFLAVFLPTVGAFDVACDLILKPLEGIIYIFDITYDFVLPLIGKALMSPVIVLYAGYSIGYVVNQVFHHLFKAETPNVMEEMVEEKPMGDSAVAEPHETPKDDVDSTVHPSVTSAVQLSPSTSSLPPTHPTFSTAPTETTPLTQSFSK